MFRRHKKVVLGAALIALAAITTQASAHVTVGIPTLSVTAVTYRAPVEPGAHITRSGHARRKLSGPRQGQIFDRASAPP